ncbi:MAG: hypothetical protein GDA54_06130 [Alphaproteobacteria bacterium GM7ARS4]|nr:hypothetical protein [Alphaproteobacteria bacterium GM7ARS4]
MSHGVGYGVIAGDMLCVVMLLLACLGDVLGLYRVFGRSYHPVRLVGHVFSYGERCLNQGARGIGLRLRGFFLSCVSLPVPCGLGNGLRGLGDGLVLGLRF